MYIYTLEVSMADKDLLFDDQLVAALKEAIDIANKSFSATRYNRTIEFIRKSEDSTFVILKMSSRDSINPTRSISSLSRALVKNENEKKSGLLDGHIINSCVFNTKATETHSESISNLNPTEIVQEVVSIVLGQKYLNDKETKLAKETSQKIKDIVLEYVNKKNEL